MESSKTPLQANVEVIPALPEQESIVANLLQLYVYDFSEIIDVQLGADGRYGFPTLHLYWKEANRYPFLIKVDGQWAGFVLVHRESQLSGDEKVYDMAEFFVVRNCRRLGVGTQVAATIWRKFPGHWELRVRGRNQRALGFWSRAIYEFTGKPVSSISFAQSGIDWHVFSFASQPSA